MTKEEIIALVNAGRCKATYKHIAEATDYFDYDILRDIFNQISSDTNIWDFRNVIKTEFDMRIEADDENMFTFDELGNDCYRYNANIANSLDNIIRKILIIRKLDASMIEETDNNSMVSDVSISSVETDAIDSFHNDTQVQDYMNKLEEAQKELSILKSNLEEAENKVKSLELVNDEQKHVIFDLQNQIKDVKFECDDLKTKLAVSKLADDHTVEDSVYAKAFWYVAKRYLTDSLRFETPERTRRQDCVGHIFEKTKLEAYLSEEERFFINHINSKSPCFTIEEAYDMCHIDTFKKQHKISDYIRNEEYIVKIYNWIKSELQGETGAKERILPIKAAVDSGFVNKRIPLLVYNEEFGINISDSSWNNWFNGYRKKDGNYIYDETDLDYAKSKLRKYLGDED